MSTTRSAQRWNGPFICTCCLLQKQSDGVVLGEVKVDPETAVVHSGANGSSGRQLVRAPLVFCASCIGAAVQILSTPAPRPPAAKLPPEFLQ